jgi:hypothetical protein
MYMKNEDAPTYGPRNQMDTISEGEVLAKALEIIENAGSANRAKP